MAESVWMRSSGTGGGSSGPARGNWPSRQNMGGVISSGWDSSGGGQPGRKSWSRRRPRNARRRPRAAGGASPAALTALTTEGLADGAYNGRGRVSLVPRVAGQVEDEGEVHMDSGPSYSVASRSGSWMPTNQHDIFSFRVIGQNRWTTTDFSIRWPVDPDHPTAMAIWHSSDGSHDHHQLADQIAITPAAGAHHCPEFLEAAHGRGQHFQVVGLPDLVKDRLGRVIPGHHQHRIIVLPVGRSVTS